MSNKGLSLLVPEDFLEVLNAEKNIRKPGFGMLVKGASCRL